MHILKVSMTRKKHNHTADQTIAPQGRYTEHQQSHGIKRQSALSHSQRDDYKTRNNIQY